jgi:hypothetical protein
MDANFRLVRLRVSSWAADPPLIKGFAYMVHYVKAHNFISTFGNISCDDAASTCNDHKALRTGSMRWEPTLAVTGVATTDCNRHDGKLPVSMCDLQVSERCRIILFVHCVVLTHSLL